VAISSGCCLGQVALVSGDALLEPVFSFASTNLESEDWKRRYSSLIALGAIAEGPTRQNFITMLMSGLPSILKMYKDEKAKVREAAGWLMARICEFHADAIAAPQYIQVLVPTLQGALRDTARVANQACHAIEHLAAHIRPSNQHSNMKVNVLTPYFLQLFEELITTAYRQDQSANEVNLALASFTALSSLCENCMSDSYPTLYEKLIPMLGLLE